jgi:hypothetical protein
VYAAHASDLSPPAHQNEKEDGEVEAKLEELRRMPLAQQLSLLGMPRDTPATKKVDFLLCSTGSVLTPHMVVGGQT